MELPFGWVTHPVTPIARETTMTNKEQQLNEQIKALVKRQKLDCWTEFIETLKVPAEIMPALITMRTELLRLAPRRELGEEQVDALYNLIGALIDTNMALREHAAELAEITSNWVGSIHGMVGLANRIGRFAQFRHEEAETETEAA